MKLSAKRMGKGFGFVSAVLLAGLIFSIGAEACDREHAAHAKTKAGRLQQDSISLVSASAQSPDTQGTQTVSFKIKGMMCQNCAKGLQTKLNKLDGVTHAKVDYAAGRAEIRYVPAKTSPDAFLKLINSEDPSHYSAELDPAKKI